VSHFVCHPVRSDRAGRCSSVGPVPGASALETRDAA
jgi:hypothetical protein